MNINWNYVLTTVCGSTAIVCAIAWLARSLFTHVLTRDVETFKVKLRTEADMQIENLRNSLQIAAIEHQVRFANLHEKQAEIVARTYTLLVALSRQAEHFVVTTEGTEPKEKREEFQKTFDQLRNFGEFIEDHKIYFPDHVLVLVEKVIIPLNKAVFGVGSHTRFRFPTEEHLRRMQDVFTEAYNAFNAEIPEAKNALIKAFRVMLGVAPVTGQ